MSDFLKLSFVSYHVLMNHYDEGILRIEFQGTILWNPVHIGKLIPLKYLLIHVLSPTFIINLHISSCERCLQHVYILTSW